MKQQRPRRGGLAICGGRHAMGGQQFGSDCPLLDITGPPGGGDRSSGDARGEAVGGREEAGERWADPAGDLSRDDATGSSCRPG